MSDFYSNNLDHYPDSWESLIAKNLRLLKQCDRNAEAKELLEFCIGKTPTATRNGIKIKLHLSGLLKEFTEKIPPKMTEPSAGAPFIRPLFNVSELDQTFVRAGLSVNKTKFVNLICTAKTLGLVCETKISFNKFKYGLLRLSKNGAEIISFVQCDEVMTISDRNRHRRGKGALCTAFGDDIIVSCLDNGLIYFPSKGKPWRYSEADGLPSNQVVDFMDCLNGKVYVCVSKKSKLYGLVEWDVIAKKSTLLISPRGNSEEGDLHESWITGIAADTSESVIWIIIRASRPHPYGLYRYDLKTRRAKLVNKEVYYSRMSRHGEKITTVRYHNAVGVIKTPSCEIDWLYRQAEGPFSPKEDTKWEDTMRVQEALLHRNSLLCLGDRPGEKKQLFYFSDNGKSPIILDGKHTPNAEEVIKMYSGSDGILILTELSLVSLIIEWVEP